MIQKNKPIAYYSKKLTEAQRNYTTTEKELLAIVMTLKEYRKMLWGTKIFIYTDHKNLTFQTFSIQRVLGWRIFIDEFDTTLRYIKGAKNVLADCFSRLPRMEKPSVGDKELKQKGKLVDFMALCFMISDNEIQKYLVHLPPLGEMYNPT